MKISLINFTTSKEFYIYNWLDGWENYYLDFDGTEFRTRS